MFDWLGDIISGMGDAIGNAFTAFPIQSLMPF